MDMSALPKIVEVVLEEYQKLLKDRIPNTVEGLYLHGSISLNAFEADRSDIDFITVMNRRLTKDEADVLLEIHRDIARKYKIPEMEGVYINWKDFGKIENDHQRYFYYNSGHLDYGPYFNFNPVTWTLLAKKGVKIIGPAITDFEMDIPTQQLQSYVVRNMNTYWVGRIRWLESSFAELLKMSVEEIQEEVEWTVLGLLRQYYTLMECDIISKIEAGKYGLKHMPEEYHTIIKEAMNARAGGKESFIGSKRERLELTIACSNYVVDYCNRAFII